MQHERQIMCGMKFFVFIITIVIGSEMIWVFDGVCTRP